jgi:sterol desaturase/sphingolipid hydroxylase (fatty acid hydroxylase superfamily)
VVQKVGNPTAMHVILISTLRSHFVFRRDEVALRGLTPLYFYTTIVICLLVITRSESPSWVSSLLLIGGGLLSWGFIEYCLHRFVFHYEARSEFGKKFVYAVHLSHHESPGLTDRIFASLIISAPVATAYLLLARLATGSWSATAYLFAGLVAGYFYYEWLHFTTHHRKVRLPLLRYLKRYHLLHHHQTPELRFGVSSPLFDIIFGTFRPVSSSRLNIKNSI